jgi:hypothetical protein
LPNYRLYRLDGAGKITAAEWIEAAHDEAALRKANGLDGATTFELWERNRLVARRQPGRGSS